MSTAQMRREIGTLLQTADDRLIVALHALMQSYAQNDPAIVGFQPDGTPITAKELLEMVDLSRREGIAGKAKTADSILSEIENW